MPRPPETAQPRGRAISHLAGPDLTIDGRYKRQLCSWCGFKLVDLDLSLVMVPEGQQGGVGAWTVGKWIEVEGVWPTSYHVVEPEDGKYPNNSCIAAEFPRERILRVVEQS